MQSANDATVLMLSKDVQNLSTAQIDQKAVAYFNALFNRTEVKNLTVKPVLSSPGQGSYKLDVTASGSMDTSFMKVFGHQSIKLDVSSEVVWGTKKLELALALDNTGSRPPPTR